MRTGAYIFPSQVVLDAQLRASCLASASMALLLDLASDTLSVDLRAVLRDGNDDEVNDPRIRRPVICLMGVAGYQEEQRIRPLSTVCVTGVSLGFLSAATVAGWVSVEDMVRMASLMATIELEEFAHTGYRSVFFYNCDHRTAIDALRADDLDDRLHLSAIVSGNQFLAACHASDMAALIPSLARVGALFKVIPHSFPGHCDLMGAVARRFEQEWRFTDQTANLAIPVVSLTDCRPLTGADPMWALALRQYTTVMNWRGVLAYLEGLQLDEYVVLQPSAFVLRSIALDPGCGLEARLGGVDSGRD